MRNYRGWTAVAISIMLVACATARGESNQTKDLVIAGYPDSGEWLMTEVLERLGNVYAKKNPDVRVKLRPRISYRLARELVLSGKACGIMISEKMNRFRAYASQTGGERGFSELKLNRFYPIATRVIRSDKKVLAKMRLGIATNRKSKQLSGFLDFLSSTEARKALAGVHDVEIAPPRPKPVRDTKGLKRGGEVKLEQPILSY